MRIRFSEHITESHRRGCLQELEQMEAIIGKIDASTYIVTTLKQTKHEFIVEFLYDEEKRGVLKIESDF